MLSRAMQPPCTLSAVEAAKKIREGSLSSVELVQSCLDRIAETDKDVKAWAFLDGENALKQAAKLDVIRKSGKPIGALHGVPVGLKDIIDTKHGTTERGSPIFKGRQAKADAVLVEKLIEAGAVILGKTVTTEMAFMNPSATRNPSNMEHTPGGSSSGSAAAVAAFQVPLAIGSQTNGSVIRPASYCGVFGFKPSSGVVSRTGMLQTSKTLDQVGVFARTLEDSALLSDVIGGYDPRDAGSYARPRPQMLAGSKQEVPVKPDFVYFDLPYKDEISTDVQEGIDAILEHFEGRVERISSPPAFAGLISSQRKIHLYEYCEHLKEPLTKHFDKVSDVLKPLIEEGRNISKVQYEEALELRKQSFNFFSEFFNDYDAIIAPSALSEAPKIDEGVTGNPVPSTIWTVAGLPCLSLPLLVGEKNLPVGLQLIGSYEGDDRLMRTANWVIKSLEAPDENETN